MCSKYREWHGMAWTTSRGFILYNFLYSHSLANNIQSFSVSAHTAHWVKPKGNSTFEAQSTAAAAKTTTGEERRSRRKCHGMVFGLKWKEERQNIHAAANNSNNNVRKFILKAYTAKHLFFSSSFRSKFFLFLFCSYQTTQRKHSTRQEG